MARLLEPGVPSRPYSTPIHLQTFNRGTWGYWVRHHPVTEELVRASRALPFSSVMTEDQVALVCDQLRALG